MQVVLKRETLSCFCCCSSPHACWSPCRSWTLACKSFSRWIQVMFFVQRNDTNVHDHQNNQSFFSRKDFVLASILLFCSTALASNITIILRKFKDKDVTSLSSSRELIFTIVPFVVVKSCRFFLKVSYFVVNCPTRWSLYCPLGICIDHLVGGGKPI